MHHIHEDYVSFSINIFRIQVRKFTRPTFLHKVGLIASVPGQQQDFKGAMEMVPLLVPKTTEKRAIFQNFALKQYLASRAPLFSVPHAELLDSPLFRLRKYVLFEHSCAKYWFLLSVTIKTVDACPPNFQVSCPTFKCRMRRFGNNLQRFAPNFPTFRQNVRANLSNFIQDLFWHVTFSNEDFKMVEDGAASFTIVKIWTWVFLDQYAAQSVGCEEESKNIYFCIRSKRVKKKGKTWYA